MIFSHLLTAALLLLVAGLADAGQQRSIRIGIFWLFPIATLKIEPLDRALALSAGGQEPSRVLRQGQALFVERAGDRLRCRIRERAERPAREWECPSLVLGEGDLNGRVRLTIPGKIMRVFQGRLGISPPRHAGDEPPTRIRVVLETTRERTVAAVTAAELPSRPGSAEREARRAAAIIARTYIASHPNRHADEGFDFCDSTHCQLYQGEDWAGNEAGRSSAEAADATQDQVLTYRGEIVETYFTGVCGGITATPEEAWGESRGAYPYTSIQCRWCRRSPRYRWQRSVSAAKLFEALRAAVRFPRTSRAELSVEYWSAGFVRLVVVSDGPRRAEIPVSRFRHLAGRSLGWNTFLSNSFTLERHGASFIVRGRGFGHNAGLCTEGAVRQAQAGRRWEEILRFYFPGAEVSRFPPSSAD